MNRNLSIHVIEELLKAGVAEFVLCPGARNAPFINLLSPSGLPQSYWYEERSASFFALGRAKALKRPVAIFTTSGTAVGEVMCAMMEAYYTSIPLIAVTADRPRRYRGTNAPQTADQTGIFGTYAPFEYDLEGQESFSLDAWHGRSPVHINVCLEEPQPVELPRVFSPPSPFRDHLEIKNPLLLTEFLQNVSSLLVIVSTLSRADREAVAQFLLRLNAPVYLEGISGLCSDLRLASLRVIEPSLKGIDGVLRLGGVPTHRIWRDLEEAKIKVDVLSISEHPFAGLSFSKLIHCRIGQLLESHPTFFGSPLPTSLNRKVISRKS